MASLLETFYILFEGDTSKLNKSTKEADGLVNQLKKDLGSVDASINTVGKSFGNMIRQAGAWLLAVGGTAALVHGAINAKNYADRLDELSKALDVDIEKLDVWQNAVKLNGGTIEGFQDTVKSMTASLNAFATTGHSRIAPFFQQLGIRLTDTTGKARNFFDILPDIADAFQKIGKSEALGIGLRMGLDQGTIMLLQQGRREVETVIKRQKELGVVNKQDAEIAAKFNDQIDDTGHAFRSVFTLINSIVLPPLTAFLHGMQEAATWLRKNSDFTKGVVIPVITALGAAMGILAIRTIAATWPFLVIVGAIAAVALAIGIVYDDIKTFEAGGRSVTGRIVAYWKNLKDKIVGYVKSIIQVLKMFGLIVSTAVEAQVRAGMEKVAHWIAIAKEKILAIITSIQNAFNRVKRFLGLGGKNDVTISIKNGQDALNLANNNTLGSQMGTNFSSSANTNNRTVNVTGPINVYSNAADATGISKDIGNGLDFQLRQANNNIDDGWMI